ncbi:MAG: RHS repeat-associated core domain-containing protein, partial [bacterium]|nr:RHS repeat-associated core domain-containing protein [bacterium]
YTYDNIGRLTGESISGDTNLNMTYAYDMRGNRTSKAVTGDENYTVSSTYDNNNRLTKQTKSVAGTQTEGVQYYYDNNGNQTFKQRFGYSTGTMMSASLSSYSHDIESFTYNAKNQLTGYTKGSTTASYTYGANGLRKSKTVGSTVTGFIWNGQNLAAETNGSTVKNIYSYGPDGIQCGNINGSDILYVKDAHGNTVTTLNGSKGSIRDYTYDAFGNQLSTITSSDTNPFRYCGEYYDKESGLMYLRNRYYDSSMGRFITEDPIKDGLNWYSYCKGNPLMFMDPFGLETLKISINIGVDYDDKLALRIGGIIEFRNVQAKATGVYCNIADIARNLGANTSWKEYKQGAEFKFMFDSGINDKYCITCNFDNREPGTFASKVVVSKNGAIVDSNDPVKQKLDSQEAYFFLDEAEDGSGIRVQAKVSTIMWCMKKDDAYKFFDITYTLANDISEKTGIPLQEVFDYLGEQDLGTLDAGDTASLIDRLKKNLDL